MAGMPPFQTGHGKEIEAIRLKARNHPVPRTGRTGILTPRESSIYTSYRMSRCFLHSRMQSQASYLPIEIEEVEAQIKSIMLSINSPIGSIPQYIFENIYLHSGFPCLVFAEHLPFGLTDLRCFSSSSQSLISDLRLKQKEVTNTNALFKHRN